MEAPSLSTHIPELSMRNAIFVLLASLSVTALLAVPVATADDGAALVAEAVQLQIRIARDTQRLADLEDRYVAAQRKIRATDPAKLKRVDWDSFVSSSCQCTP
jgi:hypothetical protein